MNQCAAATDIKTRFVLSSILGSVASGAAGEWLTTTSPDSHRRFLRGATSAYAATFVNALFVAFKPELSAILGRTFRVFGGR